MSKYVGAVRTPSGLAEANKIVGEIFARIENIRIYNTDEYELYNMCQVALTVIRSAIDRKESIGAHYIVND